MMSLGTLLVKHGWITKQHLGRAISKQRDIGGRLGTCLLEMGAIAEDLLNRSLAEQQGVPTASAEDLEEIPAKVSRLLPAPIAIRYRAVPFRASNSDVDIAMLEVDNLWLQDELSFIVGRRLNVFIANEARVVEALARYYKAPCSERFVKLLVHMNRDLRSKSDAESHPESRLLRTGEPEETTQETSSDHSRTESGLHSMVEIPSVVKNRAPQSIPVTVKELTSLGVEPSNSDPSESMPSPADFYSRDASAPTPLSLEEAEVSLETSASPEEIGRVLISVLSQEMTRVALLKVTPTQVRGWLAKGPGLDEEQLRRFQVTFAQPSIFLNLREGGSFFLGNLPEMPAHLDLLACWHNDLSDECAVFPVRVRDRLVSLVYVDCGPIGLADLNLDWIRGLCASAARAFEHCILEQKKRRQSPVAGERTAEGRRS